MRKETKTEIDKSNIFDEVKKEKVKALRCLELAKKQEAEKIKKGYKYVTSADGKTKTLTK